MVGWVGIHGSSTGGLRESRKSLGNLCGIGVDPLTVVGLSLPPHHPVVMDDHDLVLKAMLSDLGIRNDFRKPQILWMNLIMTSCPDVTGMRSSPNALTSATFGVV